MEVRIQNTTEGVGLADFTVTNTTLTSNGTSRVGCIFTNVEGPSFAAADTTTSTSPTGFVLRPYETLSCDGRVENVLDGLPVHKNVTTVTAHSVDTGAAVTKSFYVSATATDPSVKVGDFVWSDTNRNGIQDTGEPGIPGVRLTIAGPDGKPVPDWVYKGQTIGPQTTDASGHYLFKHLGPIPEPTAYTVTVDPTSPALRDRASDRYQERDGAAGSALQHARPAAPPRSCVVRRLFAVLR
jgi:hypothetical protein